MTMFLAYGWGRETHPRTPPPYAHLSGQWIQADGDLGPHFSKSPMMGLCRLVMEYPLVEQMPLQMPASTEPGLAARPGAHRRTASASRATRGTPWSLPSTHGGASSARLCSAAGKLSSAWLCLPLSGYVRGLFGYWWKNRWDCIICTYIIYIL